MNLTPQAAEELRYDWDFWARDDQKVPTVPFSVWYVKGGRGAGKTRTGAETIRRWQGEGYGYMALVGQTPGDVRDVMIEGESGILAISPSWNMPTYEPSRRRLTWPNGARAVTFSGANPDELRGPQHHKAWVDELPAFNHASETWDNLLLGLRLGDNPQVVITTTPKPVGLMRSIQSDPHTVVTLATTFQNRANLASSFFHAITERYRGTRTGLQELYALDLDEAEGALWKRNYFKYEAPLTANIERIVVAIDPAASSKPESDETGIVVVAKLSNGTFCVLDDRSGRYSPDVWAMQAINAYTELGADRVIAEVNNGGEMVEHTLRTVKRDIPYRAVHASRGKEVRAEPIAALYEQGKVFHARPFVELEDQLCTWTKGGGASPDRLDALVWAITYLMGGTDRKSQVFQTVYAPAGRRLTGLGLDSNDPRYRDKDEQ